MFAAEHPKDLEIFEKFKNKNFLIQKKLAILSKLLPEKKINILEIGFGDGNNLIEKAMANSNMNFYGIKFLSLVLPPF